MDFLFSSALAEEAAEVAEEVAEETASWFQTFIGDIGDIPVWGWGVLILLMVGGMIVWAVKSEKKIFWSILLACLGVASLALSNVLCIARLFGVVSIGSYVITELLPVAIYGHVFGILLIAGGLITYRTKARQQKVVWTTQMLSVGAMCLALSSVLSVLKLFEMPNGGSVTVVSLLPLILFAYVYGTVPGLILGFVHGVLQFLFGGWFLNIFQLLLDYPLAFAVLGLAGLFNKMKDERAGLAVGTVVGCVARWFVAALAGLVFWSDLTDGIWPAVVYTVTYNASYMIPECIITVIVAVLVGPRLIKELRKVK